MSKEINVGDCVRITRKIEGVVAETGSKELRIGDYWYDLDEPGYKSTKVKILKEGGDLPP